MIPELRDLSCEERLKECVLTTLLRDNAVKISLKKDNRTREHEVTFVNDQCRLDIRKYSFSQRTINEWNKLSIDCVTALKTRLTHISRRRITHRLKTMDAR